MHLFLQQAARILIKKGLAYCTEGEKRKFKQMYAHGNLDMPIDLVVDKMPEDKLEWAMDQVHNTLIKRGVITDRENYPKITIVGL